MNPKRRLLKGNFIRLLFGITITFALFVSVSYALPAFAEQSPQTGKGAVLERLRGIAVPNDLTTENPTPNTNPVLIAGGIVRGALTLVGLIFLILTVYGGFLYLTAGGNEETVKKGKSVIVQAMIGILIVLFAGAITQFITSQIESPGGTAACPRGPSYTTTTVVGGCEAPYTFLLPDQCVCSQ